MPGPHVVTAAICDRVLQEQDGVLSLIRVIDRLTVSASGGPDLPSELPEGQITVNFAVMLRSGDARGRHPVSIAVETPDGRTLPPQSLDVMFEGEDRGTNLLMQISVPGMEGVYWFTVSVNDRELTRSPLRVIYQRMPFAPGSSGADG